MVSDINNIIQSKDYNSETECKNLVFICANNQDFELPFAMVKDYPVFDTYAEYWEKGKQIIAKNDELLQSLFNMSLLEPISFEKLKKENNRTQQLATQKKAIEKFIKNYKLNYLKEK